MIVAFLVASSSRLNYLVVYQVALGQLHTGNVSHKLIAYVSQLCLNHAVVPEADAVSASIQFSEAEFTSFSEKYYQTTEDCCCCAQLHTDGNKSM